MEQPHISTQLEYLEKKYQEAQAHIAKLQQRLESQTYQLQEQSLRIQNLEEQLAQATTHVARIGQLDQQVEQFKEEILQLIERRYNRSQPAGPESNVNLLKQQLDNYARALHELQREVEKIRRYDDQISLLRAEATRVNKDVTKFQNGLDALGKQIDERIKPITHQEDQRRLEARLLAQIQADLPELHKKVDSSVTKLQLVEQQIPQFAKYEAALESIREDIRRHREHMDYQVAQRERQLKNWTELANVTERRLKENEAALEKYSEHYQLNKRALASLHEFQESLKNDQHRIRELQRLAEERQRAELEKFQAEYEQRWQKRAMEIQPQFSDLQRSIEVIQKKVDEAIYSNFGIEGQLNMILQIIEEDVQARTSATMDWQKRFEEIANGRTY
jgi:chromosome segregation ATPase